MSRPAVSCLAPCAVQLDTETWLPETLCSTAGRACLKCCSLECEHCNTSPHCIWQVSMSAGMGYGTCVMDIPTYYTQVHWGSRCLNVPAPWFVALMSWRCSDGRMAQAAAAGARCG